MKPTFSCSLLFQMKVLDKEKRSLYMPTLDALVINMLGEDIGTLKNFLWIQVLQFLY